MRIVLLREIPEDEALREQWNALVFDEEQPQVFYTYEWALAVYRAYRESLQPLLFLGYDEEDSLAALVALAVDRLGKRVSFLCATTGDYCDFLGGAETRELFVSAVLAELKALHTVEIVFANLPADSPTGPALSQHADTHGFHLFSRSAYLCSQVSLKLLERRGDTKPVLPRKKMLRRSLSVMGRESPVRLAHTKVWDAIEPELPEFMDAHVGRFLMTGRISNIVRRERRAFLAELAKLLSERGWIVLSRLAAGSRVFAWNYGFRFLGTWFWYQPTFDTEVEKYSPGFCLLAKLIEEAAGDPELKTVDLGLGAEEYKDRLANQFRETRYVTLSTSRRRHYAEIVRYYVAQYLRAMPRLEVLIRRGRASWSRFKGHASAAGLSGTARWLAKGLVNVLWLQKEIFFYRCTVPCAVAPGQRLERLDLRTLARAATQYEDDPATLEYLVRAASRLRHVTAEGFALLDEEGRLLHIAWRTVFPGFFLAELNKTLPSPSPESAIIFDCWTPPSVRRHGYFGQTIARLAGLICKQGQEPWIFSGRDNAASVRGIERAGFERRYSLTRRRLLGVQWIAGKTPELRSSVTTNTVSDQVLL